MDIRQAPIKDLIDYFKEAEKNEQESTSIIKTISEYYTKLTGYDIEPFYDIPEIVLPEWSFGDYIHVSDFNLPDGILVANGDKWGLTYNVENPFDLGLLTKVWIIYENKISSEAYIPKYWNCGGYISKYFNYPEQTNYWNKFGDRILKYGDNGIDVMVFQRVLAAIVPEIIISGEFDNLTLEAYHKAQENLNITPIVDTYNPAESPLIYLHWR